MFILFIAGGDDTNDSVEILACRKNNIIML